MDNFIRNIPKIELHLHIEGAIPVTALWELVKKYDKKKNIKNIRELENKFIYKDFAHFLEIWVWKNNYIREYEDITFFATEVIKDLLSQNYKYVEFFFTPLDYTDKGLVPQKVLEALYRGVKAFLNDITVNFIFDICRNAEPERVFNLVGQMKEMRSFNLVGMGMGGDEKSHPPAPFAAVYEKAREYGFCTTVHAGEAAGAQSVRDAIDYLRPDRIGHGTRMIEDSSLVDYVKGKDIHIELCPVSNIKTGVVKDIASHPVKEYFNNNLNISINTDDPKMFNTSLENEFLELKKIGFSKCEFKILLESAVRSAWCDDKIKDNLMKELDDYYKVQ